MTRILMWFAMLCLAGCTVPVVRTERITVPEVLLGPCSIPEGNARTNGALAQWLLDHRAALRECDNRMDAIREWNAAGQN